MTENTEKTPLPTDGLVARLDAADRLPGAGRLRNLSYDALGAARGTSVVDVGCGAGRAVAELTERGARAVGVDPSERMIAVARGRWPEADFRIADAYALPLPDDSMDGYRSDKVFHELTEPERALAEARRVLRPGGRILLVGQDWDALVVDSDDSALTRALVHARADLIARPRAARRYRNLLLDADFHDVTVEVHTSVFTGPAALPLLTGLVTGLTLGPVTGSATGPATGPAIGAEEAARPTGTGIVTRARTERWIAEQRERAEADRLFVAVPMVMATATAP